MAHRTVTWAVLIWTAAMALGMLGAFLGIGGDCAGLAGTELTACEASAWARGAVGLTLLVLLWLLIAAPLAIAWSRTRPKENVIVFGPAGQQVMLSEDEARKRVAQPGWTYERPGPGPVTAS
jgi:hypothetical protein